MSSPGVLIHIDHIDEANGGGELVLTYQCPTIENGQPKSNFKTERVPYKTPEEREALMQEHRRHLRKLDPEPEGR